MKNTGPLLVGLTVATIIGVAVYAYLDSFKDNAPQSEDAFLAETREAANAAPESAGEKNAKLPPAGLGSGIPQIELESDIYDMGMIANDKIAEGGIKIFNRGTTPLEISTIKTSCHCTEGEMKDKIVPPGGEGFMKITVDPFRVPMFSSRKTLTISSNDPKKPEISVEVTAKVDPEISWEPKELNFGEVSKGNAAERSFVIRQETAPFSITSVGIAGSKLDSMKATFAEVAAAERKDPAKSEYKVTVTTDGQLQADDYSAQLVLSLGGIKRVPRVTVPLMIAVKSRYKVEPSMVTLRSVSPGETVTGVLTLTSQVPVEVSGFESGNAAFSVKTRPGDTPNTIVFDVTVGADVTERVQRDTWAFVVNAEGVVFEEKIKVLAVLMAPIDIGAPVAPISVPEAATPPAAPTPSAPAPQ